MDCDAPAVPLPESPPHSIPTGGHHQALVTAAAAADDPKTLAEEYHNIKTDLEEKLHAMYLERQNLLEQEQDASFIEDTIAGFEKFMAETLTELEELLVSSIKTDRQTTERTKKKRGADDIIQEVAGGFVPRIELVPAGDGDLTVPPVKEDEGDETAEQLKKKRCQRRIVSATKQKSKSH